MADPIASKTLTLVVDDLEHAIRMNIVRDADGTPGLNVFMSLVVRAPDGKILDRIEGTQSLGAAAVAGIIDPLDVAAVRRVLVALGQKMATDAGMTVV